MTPSDAGDMSSSSGVARTCSSATLARSRQRSIAARNASTPKKLERQPDLERARAARELEPAVGEVDLVVLHHGVLEVVGRDLERAAQQAPVADQQAAAPERLVEPLVRVERDRVGQLDAAQRLAAALGDRREPAVGGVDVEPHAALAADGGQLGQRVDRAGVRGAGAADDEQRLAPGRRSASIAAASAFGRSRRVASAGSTRTWSGRKPSTRAARASDECAWPETYATALSVIGPSSASRAHASAVMFAAEPPLDEHAGRRRRVADPALEPVEHDELEPARAGGLHPGARRTG